MAIPPRSDRQQSDQGAGGQIDQENRIARLVTPLGPNKLGLTRFDGYEAMGELFEYRIDAIAKDENLSFKSALGRNCTVTLHSYNGAKRHFSGILAEAQWIGIRHRHHAYRLVLRPWLWQLGFTADCRIFKNKTVIDIIKKIFSDQGFGASDFKVTTSGDYPALEYCAQYRETDLAFVTRLMEEYGIYTYFKHEEDRHVLYLADSLSGHEPLKFTIPTGGRLTDQRSTTTVSYLPYLPLVGADRRENEHIYHWMAERRFRTGRIELRDYDYLKATQRLKGEKERDSQEEYNKSRLEVYDYPGRFTEEGVGNTLSRVKLEAEQALDFRKHATGDAASLFAGAAFTLKGHPTDDGDYVVIRATHSFEAQDFATHTGGAEASDEIYHGRYELQPKLRPFRAPQVTPRPRIYGPQTAFVVAKKGTAASEEIDTDEHGRIFVNFHWNRENKNEFCSRAVRVAQIWAGKKWGFQFIPRIGMEVVVEFLEGDPDQPLVTGCVYNSDFKYPWDLPANKTQSGIKTDSSLHDGGFNQLRFEDKAGSEEVNFQAEKDLNSLVKHFETREVGPEAKKSDNTRVTTIVHGNDKLMVKDGDRVQEIKYNWTNTVEMENWTNTVKMGNWANTVSMGNWTNQVKMGNWTVKVDLGKVEIEAMQSIELKVGQSSVKLDQMGVTVKGMMIKIEGQMMTEMKGLMTDVKGTAMLTVTGGIVMIN
ncbi:MAG: type secretion system Vgr family protein [Enterovirga sp.]|nr:type secretion system Vgr family protein [Enterovirga sp.]